MPEHIPVHIDYIRFTDKRMTLEGEAGHERMPRLLASLEADNGQIMDTGDESRAEKSKVVSFQLHFDQDSMGIRHVRGRVHSRVQLICQRCLEAMEFELESTIKLAFVRSEFEMKRAEEAGYDAYQVEDREKVNIYTLLEDELLLAMPLIPMHEESGCGSRLQHSPGMSKSDYDEAQESGNKSEHGDEFLNVESSAKKSKKRVDDEINHQKEKENPFSVLKDLINH